MAEVEKKHHLERRQIVKPCPPEGDYQGRYDYFMRKMGFKLPVTLRYALLVSLPAGVISFVRKRSVWRLPLHWIVTTNVIGWSMCYEELQGIGENYYRMKFQK